MVFLLLFYLRWQLTKTRLSTVDFYARSKFIKNSIGLALGMIALSAAFAMDAGASLGKIQGNEMELARSVLEVVALVLFGYWYYVLSREK